MKHTGDKEGKRSDYQQDGAYLEENETRTILPNEYRIIEDGKRSIKSREKVFVGKDSLDDFSGRIIKALSNPIRLKILLLLDEECRKTTGKKITDEKGIYKLLKEKYDYRRGGLYQNHLKPLQDADLIKRKSGEREGKPVLVYEIVPGTMESIITILSNLSSTVKTALDESSHLTSEYPQLKILGRSQDRDIFEVKKNPTLIGREEEPTDAEQDFTDDIIISNHYRSVTRIYNPKDTKKGPHAKLTLDDGEWYIEDCGNNRCGTFINEEKVKRKKLNDYDVIGLARGKYSVDMLYRKPNKDISLKINYFGDLEKTLSPQEQEVLAGKINILLNKVTPEFFFQTLDNIIGKIRYLQEIDTLMPSLNKDEELEIESQDENEKIMAQKIIENIREKEDLDLGDTLVNRYYSKMKGDRR